MTEEQLREILKRKWDAPLLSTSAEGDGAFGYVRMCRDFAAAAEAPGLESIYEMLAAAVLAPELWELVEAVEEWHNAEAVLHYAPDGPLHANAYHLYEVAEAKLLTALAAVKGKE